MQIDFKNKTALITGATRGIGNSIAECFYDAGADLILTGTKQEEVDRLNEKNLRLGIQNVQYLQADFLIRNPLLFFWKNLIKFVK